MAKPEEVIDELIHYRKIRYIIHEWNADYFCKKSKAEYFDMILDTFPKEEVGSEKDFVTLMEERGFE